MKKLFVLSALILSAAAVRAAGDEQAGAGVRQGPAASEIQNGEDNRGNNNPQPAQESRWTRATQAVSDGYKKAKNTVWTNAFAKEGWPFARVTNKHKQWFAIVGAASVAGYGFYKWYTAEEEVSVN